MGNEIVIIFICPLNMLKKLGKRVSQFDCSEQYSSYLNNSSLYELIVKQQSSTTNSNAHDFLSSGCYII